MVFLERLKLFFFVLFESCNSQLLNREKVSHEVPAQAHCNISKSKINNLMNK